MKENVEFEQGFKPKGKVKVQLFDENGQVINEQKSENFIAKTVQGYFDHVMRNIFTRNRATGGHQFFYYLQDPFYTMFLTDATHPESPETEIFRAGKTIGYAYTDSSYSGDDILRGSYNLSESFTNREQVHIVVDFPTHAGNGTFQSIYFSSENTSISDNIDHRISPDVYYKIQKHNEKIYAHNQSSILYLLDDDLNIIEQTEVGGYEDFWIVGNVIYYTYNRDITSAPINDPANRTSVVTLNHYISGIIRHELSGRWYLKQKGTIYVYDSSWNLLSSFEDINGASGSNLMVGTFDEGVVTAEGTFIWAGGEYNNNMITLHTARKSYYNITGFFDGYTFYRYRNTGTYRIPLVNIGSRALLDEPVTKGNTQTMKITYDFMLPPL